MPVVDFFLDGSGCEKAIYGDFSSLSNAPRPLSSLDVCGRIPVRVIQYHTVCSRQINSKAPHSSGEEEHKDGVILKYIMDQLKNNEY